METLRMILVSCHMIRSYHLWTSICRHFYLWYKQELSLVQLYSSPKLHDHAVFGYTTLDRSHSALKYPANNEEVSEISVVI